MKINFGWEIEFLAPANRFAIRKDLFEKFGYVFCDPDGYRDHWNLWHLKNDRSIKKTTAKHENLTGQEIISPVLDYDTSLAELQKVLSWIEERGYFTNVSTGLHINFSISDHPETIRDINKLKLVMLIDELGMLKEYNRIGNLYCVPHRWALEKLLKTHKKLPEEFDESQLNLFIDNSKYRTINFSKLSQGYLEFRMLGGTNYHKKFNYLRIRIEAMRRAFEAACSKESMDVAYRYYLKSWKENFNNTPVPNFREPPTANQRRVLPSINNVFLNLTTIQENEEHFNALRKGLVYASHPSLKQSYNPDTDGDFGDYINTLIQTDNPGQARIRNQLRIRQRAELNSLEKIDLKKSTTHKKSFSVEYDEKMEVLWQLPLERKKPDQLFYLEMKKWYHAETLKTSTAVNELNGKKLKKLPKPYTGNNVSLEALEELIPAAFRNFGGGVGMYVDNSDQNLNRNQINQLRNKFAPTTTTAKVR